MIEAILSSQKIFIYAKDKNFRYLFCNEALAEIADIDSPKQIIGKTDHDFVWRRQAKLYTNTDSNIFLGKTVKYVIEPQTQREKTIHLLTTKTLLRNKKGDAYAVAGHSLDVTGHTVIKNSGYFDEQKNVFYLGRHFNNEYLTKREFQIFKYLLDGYSVEKIALNINRSPKTIEAQVKSIVNKLQCSHKSEIVPTAIKHGLTYFLDGIALA